MTTDNRTTDLLHMDMTALCRACDSAYSAYLYEEAAEVGYNHKASMHHFRIARAAADEIARRQGRMMRGWTLGQVAMWGRKEAQQADLRAEFGDAFRIATVAPGYAGSSAGMEGCPMPSDAFELANAFRL